MRRPIYAVFRNEDEDHEIFMTERCKEKKKTVGQKKSEVPCEHCDVGHVSDAVRGANGAARWIDCRPCGRRMTTQSRRNATEAWDT